MLLKKLSIAALGLFAFAARADDISVLSAGAVKAPLSLSIGSYRRGDSVTVNYAPVGVLRKKIAAGERADILIATAEAMQELEQHGKLIAGSLRSLGAVGIGVAVREQAPLPDISTPEALKQTLLQAKSLTYVDPDKGTSGKHFASVLQRLGIADAVKSKTRLAEGGAALESVARGEVEIGVQQISEILPVQGVKLIGPLPAELQKITTYTAGVMAGSKSPQAAAALIRYLRRDESNSLFVSYGFSVPTDKD